MFREMEEQGLPDPEYSEPSGFAVRMVLRNNIEQRIPRLKGQTGNNMPDIMTNGMLNDRIKGDSSGMAGKVLAAIARNPEATAITLAEQLGSSERTVRRYLRQLQEQGLLERSGSRKTGIWVIREDHVSSSDSK